MAAALESLPSRPSRALDVGTGTGAVARLMAGLLAGRRVIGVDASPGMISEARDGDLGARALRGRRRVGAPVRGREASTS